MYSLLFAKSQLVNLRENNLYLWHLSLNSFINPYPNKETHFSNAYLLKTNYLILFDFEDTNYETESFVLIDLNFNVVINRVLFKDTSRRGADIFNSYLIDEFGRIFFSTKIHMNGNGQSSRLYYLDIFNQGKDDRIEFLYEDSEEIMFIDLEASTKGFLFFI